MSQQSGQFLTNAQQTLLLVPFTTNLVTRINPCSTDEAHDICIRIKAMDYPCNMAEVGA
jgi:hypothetical protein